jgi:hypothetical protein
VGCRYDPWWLVRPRPLFGASRRVTVNFGDRPDPVVPIVPIVAIGAQPGERSSIAARTSAAAVNLVMDPGHSDATGAPLAVLDPVPRSAGWPSKG